MRARSTAAILLSSLGIAGVVAAIALADPPVNGNPAVIYRTKTVVKHERYQGLSAHQWARRAVGNRRKLNTTLPLLERRGKRIRRLQHQLADRWEPTVDYGLQLAAHAYAPFGGPSYSKLRAVAMCESTLNPFATNGQYVGIFQAHWAPFGTFSRNDPVAQALDTAATVIHDGSWRQWECKNA